MTQTTIRFDGGASAGRRLRRRSRRGGFTLLEILIASSALLVAMLGFSQALVMATRSQTLTREKSVATEACRRQIELMRSNAFQYVFRRFNTTGADDVAGANTDPGATFAIEGLEAVDGGGFAGEIEFPVDATAPGELREDLNLPTMGLPRDLDMDGVIDATDHSADAVIIPVIVRARWRGAAGPAMVEIVTYIGDDL